jgi:Na+/melibiose symporter-like transporter
MAAKYVPSVIAAGEEPAGERATLDWLGLLLVVFSTLALLNGLGGLQGNASGLAIALLLASALALWFFVRLQKRLSHAHRATHPRMPLMNMALFNHRTFSMGGVVSFIYGGVLFGSTYLLPVYLQMGLGLSAAYVGTMLLPAGLALAVTIPVVGRMADKYPTHWLVSAGLVLLAAGFALMVTVNLQTAVWIIVLWVVVGRVGLGFILPSLTRGSLVGLGKNLLPQGSSSINFARMVGGAVGVRMCAIALDWRLAAHGESLANPSTSPGRLLAFNEAFLMLALVCALALFAAWNLRSAEAAHTSH